MEKVTLNGKTYVKASVIAQHLGYTTDYVGQLCRANKVDSQLIGRSWYVEQESINDHKANRYRSTKAATQKTIKKQLQDSNLERAHFYTHDREKPTVAIQYDTDDAELFPEVHKSPSVTQTKLEVGLAGAKEVDVKTEPAKYHFEAPEREEIQFHGTLRISEYNSSVAVSEDEEDHSPHSVSILRKQGSPKKMKKKNLSNTDDVVSMTRITGNRVLLKNKKTMSPKNGEVVVQTEQEAFDVSTSIIFKLSVSSLVAVSLFIALAFVSLETHVVADGMDAQVDYVFVLKSVAAQLYQSI